MGRSVVLVKCSGAEVRRFHGGTDQMGFANPRPLYMWKNNRNNMAGRLERVDEGMDVGGGLVRRRTVVVCDLGLDRLVRGRDLTECLTAQGYLNSLGYALVRGFSET